MARAAEGDALSTVNKWPRAHDWLGKCKSCACEWPCRASCCQSRSLPDDWHEFAVPRSARTVGCVSAGQESVVSSSGRSRCQPRGEHVQPHALVNPFSRVEEKERRLCTSPQCACGPLCLSSPHFACPDRSLKAQGSSPPSRVESARLPLHACVARSNKPSRAIQRSAPRSAPRSSSFPLSPEAAALHDGGTLTCFFSTLSLSLPLPAHPRCCDPCSSARLSDQDRVAAATRPPSTRPQTLPPGFLPAWVTPTTSSKHLSIATRRPGARPPNSNAAGVARAEQKEEGRI